MVPSRNQDPQSPDCWRVLTDVSEQVAAIVTVHDPDGVSFRFLKAQYLDSPHVKSVAECRHILAHIILDDGMHDGGTELLGQFEKVIDQKISVLIDHRRRQVRTEFDGSNLISLASQPEGGISTALELLKGLNLIVITDGQVDDRNEIEEYMIEVARELDRLDAPRAYINVQFVQVGDDQNANPFLRHLENGLRDREDSPRDVGSSVLRAFSWARSSL